MTHTWMSKNLAFMKVHILLQAVRRKLCAGPEKAPKAIYMIGALERGKPWTWMPLQANEMALTKPPSGNKQPYQGDSSGIVPMKP